MNFYNHNYFTRARATNSIDAFYLLHNYIPRVHYTFDKKVFALLINTHIEQIHDKELCSVFEINKVEKQSDTNSHKVKIVKFNNKPACLQEQSIKTWQQVKLFTTLKH